MDAIIFLAPISAFDQVLVEVRSSYPISRWTSGVLTELQDTKCNRLQDSLNLWESVVSNRLLGNVNLILFLNKVSAYSARLSCFAKRSSVRPAEGMYTIRSVTPRSANVTTRSQKKLQNGVKLRDHLRAYRDRPNDYDSVTKCTFR